jgi:simple sugar transport system permease protein
MLSVVFHSIFSALFLASVFRISTPLILPALGGLLTDLSGSVNIALEGDMLVAAFAGVIVSGITHNWLYGVLAGMAAGIILAGLLAFFSLYLKTNIILAGIALNIMADGLTVFLLYVITGDKGNSANWASMMVPTIDIPLLKDIPFLGTVLSGHNIFTYLAFIMAALVALLLYHTRFGAHLRAVGENPEAAMSVGINVRRTQTIAILISGGLAALGGLDLSMAYLSLFQREMVNGRGFIALAAIYLGGRTPWGTVVAAIIFGAADALSNQLGTLKIPTQLVQTIPYLATIIALVVYGIRKQAVVRERARKFQEKHMADLAASAKVSE